jgi:dinuclear metal center YbgI/SA1388 family protein
MKLMEIVSFLNDYLKVDEWAVDSSKNGLQVESCEEVEKVAFAVDACMSSFTMAVEEGANLLITHHGLIWNGIDRLTGLFVRRVKFLLESGLSLYTAHLPLDAHPVVGNNVLLLKMCGFLAEEPFGFYRGKAVGFAGRAEKEVSVNDVAKKLERELKTDVTILDFGGKIKKAGAISGRGGFAVEDAWNMGLDLLITGEKEHSAYNTAKDLGINVIFAGHYATETLGVKALMDVVKKFGVDVVFLDLPTGL